MKKIKNTKQLLFENMVKLNHDFKQKKTVGYGVPDPLGTNKAKPINNESFDIDAYGEDSVEFKEMAEKIKKAIDDLYVNGDYNILTTLYGLMVERKAKFSKKDAVAITEWINQK